jgi:hypothetical protein
VRTLAELERRLDEILALPAPRPELAAELLEIGEQVLEHWVGAKGLEPTRELREGFRLLALHRQGCQGEPSFNACRETCRELVYQYNLVTREPRHDEIVQRLRMMAMVANHLFLFVAGKLQVSELGDFCCVSRPLRQDAEPREPA